MLAALPRPGPARFVAPVLARNLIRPIRATVRWALGCFASCALLSFGAEPGAGDNLRAVVSQADLTYPAPVTRSEEGLPLGNGRMGSLVWTTPTSVRLQINRVDLQPISASTVSLFERNSDYMGGCGFVDIDLGAAGDDVFAKENCPQRLAVFEGLATLTGQGVAVRAVATPHADVFALEINDHRRNPQPITIGLRMLRYATQHAGDWERLVRERIVTVRTREHTATSQLHIQGERIALSQEFREGRHVAKSAVTIAVPKGSAKPRFTNETTVTLALPAKAGRFTMLIASAATLDSADDVVTKAAGALEGAAGKTFEQLREETAAWWQAFWARGVLDLRSTDGVAQEVAANYHYFLYLMAATSRGKFPPKFNGMLWNTAGDLRTWGAQHWYANLSCYYEALFASGRHELLEPMFAFYSGIEAAAARAAREQWGSDGIFIPETSWFDGLAPLPESIAAEMGELYLLRKPWAERSREFLEFAATKHPHSSRWNWWGGGSYSNGRWVPVERGHGPFGPVTHILGTTAKVAYYYWRYYEYTLDREWLRTRAYPMIRGAAEFYRNFPNLRPDERGVLHMHHTNSNESVQNVRDSDEDLAAMRGIFSVAIRAATLLDVDPQLRAQWQTTLSKLAPLPTSADADAVKPEDYAGPAVFTRGRVPVAVGRGFTPDGNSLPHWLFDLCNLDSPDAATLAVANATFDRFLRGAPANTQTAVGVLSKWAIAGAMLGRVDATRHMIVNQMRSLAAERETAYLGGRPLANRLSLREGHQAADAQRLGRAAEALQIALLNSTPRTPGDEPILRLFAAWPPEWDATFTLRARGGFVVSAQHRAGRVDSVEIDSEAGAPLLLRNPWPGVDVTVSRGDREEVVRGAVLKLPTQRGERLRFHAR
jgi:hypothetical protein